MFGIYNMEHGPFLAFKIIQVILALHICSLAFGLEIDPEGIGIFNSKVRDDVTATISSISTTTDGTITVPTENTRSFTFENTATFVNDETSTTMPDSTTKTDAMSASYNVTVATSDITSTPVTNDSYTTADHNTTTVLNHTNSATNTPTACPVFPLKEINGSLILQLPGGHCEIKVSIMTVRKPGQSIRMSVLDSYRFKRNTHLAHVEIVHSAMNMTDFNMTAGMPHAICPKYPIRNLGLITVVDTVPDQCQIAFGVKRKKVSAPPGTRVWNLRERFSFRPVYEYIDGVLFPR